MQKETRRNSAAGSAKPNPPRKLTRAEKKQIAEIIRQAKGDGKAHTAQQIGRASCRERVFRAV